MRKITRNKLFFRDSQFWDMAEFFQIGFRDIAMTCTNIVLGHTLLKLLKLLGPTHNYKRVHDVIVWPCGFLKYTYKLRGLLSIFTHLTEADTNSFHRLSSVDIISIGSLGPIRYFNVFLGHFDGYFGNSEKGPKCLMLTRVFLKFISEKQKYC